MNKNMKDIENMASLLKSGATMLFEHCPQCDSPLFKLQNDEIWCPRCNKKVVKLKKGEEISRSTSLKEIEKIVFFKLKEISLHFKDENDFTKLENLSNLLSLCLDILHKIRKI